ncbi:RNA polymerase sigma factor [Streptomyces mirabilis]|uniref:RNA polymerase sigma factor n=1 Tax=Streptomyces mirabilis TaxID=68239 RepID=UPI0036A7BE05
MNTQPKAEDSSHDGFVPFFSEQFPQLVAILMSKGYGREDSLDAAESAMTDACSRWGELRSPKAYALKIAVREAAKNASRGREDIDRAIKGDWARPPQNTERVISRIEDEAWLICLLSQLPEGQRNVMALWVDNVNEIAQALEIKKATVRSHLRYARATLKKLLGEKE